MLYIKEQKNMTKKDAAKTKKFKGKKRIVVAVVIIVAALYFALQVLPYNGFGGESKFKVAEGEPPLVIAHGGAKHLYPENTVMAFEESFAMGVDVLEMDLCLTKDGTLVTHHDLTVDATSNATGYVNDYTAEQIAAINFGYDFVDIDGSKPYENETDPKILSKLVPMTVEQMFETFGSQTLYIMEIKDAGETGIAAAEELNKLINEYNLQEYVCVAAFNQEVIEYFSSIKHDSVNVSMDFDTAESFIILNYLGVGMFTNFEHAGLQIPSSFGNIPLDNSYLVYKIHHNNMFLHYWTINEKQEIEKLIELGCDGIITDRPDIMIETLREMGF